MKSSTTREKVLKTAARLQRPITAIAMAKKLSVRVDSLSSLLKRMCDDSQLETVPAIGPRGGAGYKLSHRERVAIVIRKDGGIGKGVRRATGTEDPARIDDLRGHNTRTHRATE